MSASVPPNPEWAFFLETIKKLFIFVVIALSVVGLHHVVNFLEQDAVPSFFIGVLRFVEVLVFIIDVFWFLRHLLDEALKISGEIFAGSVALRLAVLLVILILVAIATPSLIGWSRDLFHNLVDVAQKAAT